MKPREESSEATAALLDDALMELKEGERQALLLRYFEQRNHREIGQALGIGEDAARKRVDKALRQLTESFRARGLAAGSSAVAATLQAATQTAPAALAAQLARAAVGAKTQALWLGRILGVGKAQLAGLCLVLLIVPPAWQQGRLVSARAEQGRLAGMLARVESEHADIQEQITDIEGRIQQLLAQVDVARSVLHASADPASTNLHTALFHWNEEKDYVVVPKDVLTRITFDTLEDEWGLETGSRETFDRIRRRVAPAVLAVLGLSAGEQEGVQNVFVRYLNLFGRWSEANGYLAEFASVESRLPDPSNGTSAKRLMKFNEHTSVWVSPGASDSGAWVRQFKEELSAIMGAERAEILVGMARDDGSLGECLQQFGVKESYIVITPNLDGGFWLSHNTKGTWLFNSPCTFSEVLEPAPDEPFDEVAFRRQLVEAIQKRRAEFPDEEIPPIDRIIEGERYHSQRTARNKSVVQIVLGRPLPQPVVEYLRQWRAAHPDVPDTSTSTTKHP
jgi:hypothetical protein